VIESARCKVGGAGRWQLGIIITSVVTSLLKE
jgi:hypothetical protein